jgi:hypothetical protein
VSPGLHIRYAGQNRRVGRLMKTKHWHVGLIVVAVVSLFALAGCAPALELKVSATVSPTPTPAPVYVAGAVVPSDAKLPVSQIAYKLADQTYVVVDNTQPFPPVVISDIQSAAIPVIAQLLVPMNPTLFSHAVDDQNRALHDAAVEALKQFLYAKHHETGKDIIAVIRYASNTNKNSEGLPAPSREWFSYSSRGPTGVKSSSSLDVVLTGAKGWASTADAEVIVLGT